MSKEYLSRESIPNIKFNINRYEKIDIKELLKKRSKLIKTAKEKDIKISYKNKTKDKIKLYKDAYEKDYKRSEELYKEIKTNWEYIRDIRGIHKGTNDDELMNKTSVLTNEYISLNYRNRAISIINELNRDLTKGISDNTFMIFL